MHGSHKAHQVQFASPQDLTLVEFRNLSCHCPRLKPMNCVETREIMHNEDEELEFGVNGEGMVDGVVVGDNITLLCQSGGNETFWIMLGDTLVNRVVEHFIDAWG